MRQRNKVLDWISFGLAIGAIACGVASFTLSTINLFKSMKIRY